MASGAGEWAGRPDDELPWLNYRRALVSEGKSPDTVDGYRRTLQDLSRSLPDGTDLTTMGREDVARWLEAGATGNPDTGTAPWARSSHASYMRRARTYCTWALQQGYADASPLAGIRAVKEDITEVDIPDTDDIRAVASVVSKGKGWMDRRDWAIFCLLAEAGTPRATEMAELTLKGLDLKAGTLQFVGKGGLERTISLGAGSCRALTLWLRERGKRRDAALPWLFLGLKGPLTRHGVRQMVGRRCRQAGVKAIPPHHFRHLTASEFMDAGGSVVDAMKLFGWRTPLMASRYGSAAAGRRAVRHAAEMSLGDRIMSGK
jgi:integrase/recombinase XerC